MELLHQEPLDVSSWHSLVRGSVLNYIVLALSLPWDFIKQAFHLADSLGFTELLLGHYQMLLLVLNCSRSWLHLPEFLLWKPAGQIIYMKTCQNYNWDIQYGIITGCCSIASSVIAIQAGWPPLVLQDCTPVSLLSQFIRCLHTCLVLQSIVSWPFVFLFFFFFFFFFCPSLALGLSLSHCSQGIIVNRVLVPFTVSQVKSPSLHPDLSPFIHTYLGIGTKIVKSLDTWENRLSQNIY